MAISFLIAEHSWEWLGSAVLAAMGLWLIFHKKKALDCWPIKTEPGALALLALLVFCASQMIGIGLARFADGRPSLFYGIWAAVRLLLAGLALLSVAYLDRREDPILDFWPTKIKALLWPCGSFLLLLPLVLCFAPSEEISQNVTQDLLVNKDFLQRLAAFLLLVVASPIFEEVLFRGLVQGALRRAFPAPAAILLSAGAFACVHPQVLWFQVFLLGLLLGYFYERKRGLWAPTAVHLLNNAITFVYFTVFYE